MEHKVTREAVKVTLELTQEEFNTIVCGFGASNDSQRQRVANNNDLKIITGDESEVIYRKLKKIAINI